jgi:outer membrane protein assembly factor BamB
MIIFALDNDTRKRLWEFDMGSPAGVHGTSIGHGMLFCGNRKYGSRHHSIWFTTNQKTLMTRLLMLSIMTYKDIQSYLQTLAIQLLSRLA